MTEILDEAAVSEIGATVNNNIPLQEYLTRFGVDVPALCATVKHLRAENARLQKHIADVEHDFECAVKENDEHGTY